MKNIIENRGSGILSQYNNSVIQTITNIYSNYDWLPWKFDQIPSSFWDERTNVQRYMNWLSFRLNINSMEDWYQVTFLVNYFFSN